MMPMIETATVVRFPAGENFCSSFALPHYRHTLDLDEVNGILVTSLSLIRSHSFAIPWSKFRRLKGGSLLGRSSILKNRIRASSEHLSSASDPSKWSDNRGKYHPFEEIAESTSENNGEAMLTAQETARIIVEQAITGFDAIEILSEMELLGLSEIDFGIEEIEGEDNDVEDDEDELIAVIEDEDEEHDSDETLGDWAKLETMRSSHPMYFAKKLAEVASDDPIDWMEQPPAGLAIQGIVRPALLKNTPTSKGTCLVSSNQSHHTDINDVGKKGGSKLEDPGRINGYKHEPESSDDISIWAEESREDQIPRNGTSFYKLEMIKIQLMDIILWLK